MGNTQKEAFAEMMKEIEAKKPVKVHKANDHHVWFVYKESGQHFLSVMMTEQIPENGKWIYSDEYDISEGPFIYDCPHEMVAMVANTKLVAMENMAKVGSRIATSGWRKSVFK